MRVTSSEGTTPSLSLVTRLVVQVAPAIRVGTTPAGVRAVVPITGGTMRGPLLRGTVIGAGSDWNVIRRDEVCQVSAHYLVQTDDGVVIDVLNEGVVTQDDPLGLTTPRFEAPDGPYDWLNRHVFVGTVLADGGETVTVDLFRVDGPRAARGARVLENVELAG